ncbi:MAG: hypothetical protein GY813_19275, partial [Halieaceae bacterium]|nr:hypothetical protein [Halieaceae bacterium]
GSGMISVRAFLRFFDTLFISGSFVIATPILNRIRRNRYLKFNNGWDVAHIKRDESFEAEAYRTAFEVSQSLFSKTKDKGFWSAGCYAMVGDADAAFASLNRAIDNGWRGVTKFVGEPNLASLHSDARWHLARARAAQRD